MKRLWLSQEPGAQAQRMDVLLACFDLSSSREELQAVESPFQALCCLLIYLFVQVTSAPRGSVCEGQCSRCSQGRCCAASVQCLAMSTPSGEALRQFCVPRLRGRLPSDFEVCDTRG